MLKELEFDENQELDFELLIKAALEIGNSLDGQKTSIGRPNIYFAEGIGQKILSHVISAHYLSKGYPLATDKHLFVGQIDFSSVSILVRAALESYLTFNYVFVSAKGEDELTFRFNCWNLGGFIDRSDFIPTEEQHVKLKGYESEQINIIQAELQKSDTFKNLNAENKKAALNGKWKLLNSWSKLAVNAGFNKKFFDNYYKFLCSHAHSSRLSIIQIQQTKDLKTQSEMSNASIGIVMVVLAKYLFDYIHLIPELNHFTTDKEKYALIAEWKQIGEEL
jgi:hypothetical protein